MSRELRNERRRTKKRKTGKPVSSTCRRTCCMQTYDRNHAYFTHKKLSQPFTFFILWRDGWDERDERLIKKSALCLHRLFCRSCESREQCTAEHTSHEFAVRVYVFVLWRDHLIYRHRLAMQSSRSSMFWAACVNKTVTIEQLLSGITFFAHTTTDRELLGRRMDTITAPHAYDRSQPYIHHIYGQSEKNVPFA